MKCLYKNKKNILKIKDVEKPKIKKGYSIIKIKYSGICKTDIFVAENKYKNNDLILGHEFSGIIVETTSNKLKINDKVGVNPLINNKFLGMDKNGSFAEYISIPNDYIINMNEVNDFKLIAYLEPVRASLAPLNSKNIDKNKKGLIIGNKNNRITKITYLLLKDILNLELKEDINDIKENKYDFIIENDLNQNILDKIPYILKENGVLIIKSRSPKEFNINFFKYIEKNINIEAYNYYNFNKTRDIINKNQKKISKYLGKSFNLEDYKKRFKEDKKGIKKIFFKIN